MEENKLRPEVAACCRMLEYLGLFDFSGHASARIPGTDSVLINSKKSVRSRLGPQDIVKVNLQDDVIPAETMAPSETYIHTLIYRQRPDVQAVAHLHSPAVIALSVTGKKFTPVLYRSYIFSEGVPLYNDSRTVGTAETGRVLAEALGQNKAVMMRGHGSVVVAEDMKALLFNCLTLELNAKNQIDAYKMGEQPVPVTKEEIAEGYRHFGPKTFDKAWQFYRDKAALDF